MAQSSGATNHVGREPLIVDLALQGGGTYGAFTWGVLDRLLEEPWLRVGDVTATSAGAINAALLAYGYQVGGAEGARAKLADFWRRISIAAAFGPFRRSPVDMLLGRWSLDHSPMFLAVEMAARLIAPYDLNARALNPLRDILDATIDFAALGQAPIRLFVTATNVRTTRGRLFTNAEIDADVLLASACLPTLFQAVIIDGDPYWDGGYSGNPTFAPLVREGPPRDTILVQINPIERAGAPHLARDIATRLNEVSFNATLFKELKMMALLRQSTYPDDSEAARWAAMRLHRIATDRIGEFGYTSKHNAEWPFLCLLRDEGRSAAHSFLRAHGDDLGQRSSLDLDELLKEG